MPTKPSSAYAPRPRKNAPATGSAKDAFIDVDKVNADDYSKLTVRLRKSLHKDVKARALAEDTSVQEFVQAAITEKLARKTTS